jgi:hypothetical protein
VKTMLEYSIGRPRTRSESDAVDNKQLPRMIFLHKPHDSLATPGEPNKPLRILGQVAGPNGEIVDFRTGKVVVPAPAKSVSGDDGLGEGEDRLELVEDLPSPCPTCGGCGRQGIGFGSQTEPCGDCGGAGRLR